MEVNEIIVFTYIKNLQKIKIQKINQNNTFRMKVQGRRKTFFLIENQAIKHVNKQTNKQTNKQINKQTNKQKNK